MKVASRKYHQKRQSRKSKIIKDQRKEESLNVILLMTYRRIFLNYEEE